MGSPTKQSRTQQLAPDESRQSSAAETADGEEGEQWSGKDEASTRPYR